MIIYVKCKLLEPANSSRDCIVEIAGKKVPVIEWHVMDGEVKGIAASFIDNDTVRVEVFSSKSSVELNVPTNLTRISEK